MKIKDFVPKKLTICDVLSKMSGVVVKPWLILVNPASGTKLAGKMFKSIVKPAMDEKQVHYEVMETEYAGQLH